jgi:protocatechuate 3,4-dioxygenase beta subunit
VGGSAPATNSAAGGGTASNGSGAASTTTSSSTTAAGQGGAGGAPLLECTATADNLVGPYYRPLAPFREDLTDPGMPGTRLTVSGRVLNQDCEPIDDALVDVWQADSTGDYDNDGDKDPPAEVFVLRGRQRSRATGDYSFRTVVPGHYLNGAQYRPAHIHVTVSAIGYLPVTTQLYFEGDPYNGIDPFLIDSLVMSPVDVGSGELVAAFDFVLERA